MSMDDPLLAEKQDIVLVSRHRLGLINILKLLEVGCVDGWANFDHLLQRDGSVVSVVELRFQPVGQST